MKGERIRLRRKELGISGEKIAKAIGTTRVTVSRWEAGVSEPNDKKKIALANMLNTSVAYLMGETDNPEPIASIEIQHSLQGDEQDIDYAYWGGIVNNVRKLLARGDKCAIMSITPLLKLAYEMLAQGEYSARTAIAQMPIWGGSNNTNTQNVRIDNA